MGQDKKNVPTIAKLSSSLPLQHPQTGPPDSRSCARMESKRADAGSVGAAAFARMERISADARSVGAAACARMER